MEKQAFSLEVGGATMRETIDNLTLDVRLSLPEKVVDSGFAYFCWRNSDGVVVEQSFPWQDNFSQDNLGQGNLAVPSPFANDIRVDRASGEHEVPIHALSSWLKGLDSVDTASNVTLTFSPSVHWLMDVWKLATAIVQSRDVFAGAFSTRASIGPARTSLREMARAGDDFLPASGDGSFIAKWLPAWSSERFLAARFHVVVGAERVNTVSGSSPSVEDVDWLLICLVDAVTRKGILSVSDSTVSTGQTYRVMYRGEEDVIAAWSAALQSTALSSTALSSTAFPSTALPSTVRQPSGESFRADGWLIARSMRSALVKSGWASDALEDQSGRFFYEVIFRLHPPVGEASMADWYLSFHMRHRFSRATYAIADWWKQPSRRWRVGEESLLEPDTWFLPALREASRVCPIIDSSFGAPVPIGCVISVDDVYRFLAQYLPALQSIGFAVEAPEILRAGNTRVRVRVQGGQRSKDGRKSFSAGGDWFRADGLVEFDWSVVVEDQALSRDDFMRMVDSQTPFIQVGGSWRLVPVEEILQQLDTFGIGRDTTTTVLDLSRTMSLLAEAQDVPVDVVYADEAADVRQAMEAFENAVHVPELPTPHGFVGELRHYQAFGYAWLMRLRSIGCGACLADDMGLGKTVQVLAYFLRMKEQGETQGTHLLVCPTSLLANWQAEIKRFAPGLTVYVHHGTARDMTNVKLRQRDFDVVMTTYATLVRDLDAFLAVDFDCVVVDEAQNIKNSDTKQAQALRMIRAVHRVVLTGTPIENRLEELWALMDFLNPGYLGSLSWFRKTFANLVQGRASGNAASKLQLLLRPVLLRRRKTDPDIQTELPEKWEVEERAYLTSEQAALYQAFVDQLFTGIHAPEIDAMSRRGRILATLVRLKQVCDHPCLISGGLPTARRSGKLRQLIDLLTTVVDEGECGLVFTQFRDMGEILCDALETEFGVRPRFLHGGLSAAARGELVEAFQSGKDPSSFLVLSLRAGGVGLNLTRANHVFHFDRWWNPAVEDQATDRAYRIGQTKDVQVHKMICSGTLEERIDQLIMSKRELSEVIVSSSNDWVTELDDETLRELFTLGPQDIWEEEDA